MQHDRVIILMVPRRISGVDVGLPLAFSLQSSNDNVSLIAVFQTPQDTATVRSSPVFQRALESSVEKQFILRHRNGAPDLLQIACLILNIAKANKPILLHAGDASRGILKYLAAIVHLKNGTVFGFPNSSAVTYGRPVRSVVSSRSEGDGYLCFNETEAAAARERGRARTIIVGFPRFYRAWEDHIRAITRDQTSAIAPWFAAAKLQGRIVLVLPSSTVAGVYEPGELENWMDEVVGAVRKQCVDYHIIVKPHPMQKQAELDMIASKLSSERDAISHVHTMSLASISSLAISCSSSVVIDALAMGTPVVLHQRFTSHWLKRHPEGSSYLEFGIEHTDSIESLAGILQATVNGSYRVPDVRSALGHNDTSELILLPRARESKACA